MGAEFAGKVGVQMSILPKSDYPHLQDLKQVSPDSRIVRRAATKRSVELQVRVPFEQRTSVDEEAPSRREVVGTIDRVHGIVAVSQSCSTGTSGPTPRRRQHERRRLRDLIPAMPAAGGRRRRSRKRA
jgi:hypothetical protein